MTSSGATCGARLTASGAGASRLRAGDPGAAMRSSGGRRVVLVGADDGPGRGPLRDAPDAAGGDVGDRAGRRVDDDEGVAVQHAARRREPVPVRVPRRLAVVGVVARELPLAAAVGADEVERPAARALGGVGQRGAVGRPGGRAVLHAGRARDRAHGAAVEPRDADLGALEVGAGLEQVRHLAAVRGDDRVPLVAALLEPARVGGEPARPGVGDGDDREPRLVVALDGDDERGVVDPDGRAQLAEVARRAARRGDDPDVAVLRIGDLRPVGGELRVGVVPVGHRVAAVGQPLRRRMLEVEEPDVGGVAVVDEDGVPAVGADGERARPLRGGDGLEPPVRRRLDVLALGHRDALELVLADPQRWLSHAQPPRLVRSRCPPARPARAHRSCARRSRPPARRRWGARAPRAPCRRRGSRRR